MLTTKGIFSAIAAPQLGCCPTRYRSEMTDWTRYWQGRAPYDRAVDELRQGDGSSFELVVRYLAERPRFLQSGYIAERMLRYLDRVELTAGQRHRVVAIAEHIADEGRTREARQAKLLLARLNT